MLRLLEIFLVKNSSPFFSKLVRVRGPNHYILLIGTIKPCNLYYQNFLLRPFLGEIFAVPFHRAKMIEQGETVRTKRSRQMVFSYFNVCWISTVLLPPPIVIGSLQISTTKKRVKSQPSRSLVCICSRFTIAYRYLQLKLVTEVACFVGL